MVSGTLAPLALRPGWLTLRPDCLALGPDWLTLGSFGYFKHECSCFKTQLPLD